MKKLLIIVFISSLIVSCNPKTVKQENSFTDKPASNSLIITCKDEFRNIILPLLSKDLQSVDKRFDMVIDYGASLEKNPLKNIDSLTIYSNKYWKAFIAMSAGNPTVYNTRISLLMKEGYVDKAGYVLLMSIYHTDFKREDNMLMFNKVNDWYTKIKNESNVYVEKGVLHYDKGNIEEALNMYSNALIVFPKNPWAYYEIGLTKMMNNLFKKSESRDSLYLLNDFNKEVHQTYFALTKQYDPFYQLAYQGNKEQFKYMLPIMKKVNPSLALLKQQKGDVNTFITLAEGCEEMGQLEIAAYSYFQAILSTFNGKFNIGYANKFVNCLEALGCKEAADFYSSQIEAVNNM